MFRPSHGIMLSHLHLRRDHAESSRKTKQNPIIFLQFVRCDDGIIFLGWSMHFSKNFVGKCLGNLEYITTGTSSNDTLLDSMSHGGHMAVKRIVNNGNLCHSSCTISKRCVWMMLSESLDHKINALDWNLLVFIRPRIQNLV